MENNERKLVVTVPEDSFNLLLDSLLELKELDSVRNSDLKITEITLKLPNSDE